MARPNVELTEESITLPILEDFAHFSEFFLGKFRVSIQILVDDEMFVENHDKVLML